MYNFSGFTQTANQALCIALNEAEKLGHSSVGTEHLLYGLSYIEGSVSALILNRSGIDSESIEEKLVSVVGKDKCLELTPDDFTPRVTKILNEALNESKRMGHRLAGTEHLLLSFLNEEESYGVLILQEMDASPHELYTMCISRLCKIELYDDEQEEDLEESSSSPLKKYGKDLTLKAKKGLIDPVIGRQNEINRAIRILARRSKNNPCLIGDPGVGKTAIAEGLAIKIINEEVPLILKNKHIVSLDLTSMLAGAKYRGDFEERIKSVLDETSKRKDTILFIDELHTVVGAGAAEGAIDAANILKPQLSRGEIQIIGATTADEYRKYIEKDQALERRFQTIFVEEPSIEQSRDILNGIKDRYEQFHSVSITDSAVKTAVDLASRYIHDRFLPDKAIDLMDEASSRARIKNDDKSNLSDAKKPMVEEKITNCLSKKDFKKASELLKKQKPQTTNKQINKDRISVTSKDMMEIASEWTGIPLNEITQNEKEKLLCMDKTLSQEIIGQDDAISSVCRAIRRNRTGVTSSSRPIGSFLFLGPTGVGKTQLCKDVAGVLFGDKKDIIKLDMSEYMEGHSVSKMIGAPPGYVGFEEGGALTEQVRKNPYCVVLFDEIEKAHSDVYHILLQILEDGTLTDSQGRKVNFCNTVVILTSNIAAQKLENNSNIGFIALENSKNYRSEVIKDELQKYFKPEFLNRLDEVIVFNNLNKSDLIKISKLQLDCLKCRLDQNGYNLKYDSGVLDLIVKLGMKNKGGARPLRRIISSQIEDLLSMQILQNDISVGDTFFLKTKDDKFIIDQKLPLKKA